MQQHVDVYRLTLGEILGMPFWHQCEVIAQLPEGLRKGIYRVARAVAVPS